jgi:DNA (cytosine-5)-methyltransferase 1
MSRPRLLDLFCGAGGAAMGYHQAGFDVVGVDINPQPHYPFEFHQADAMTYPLDGFDAIHASPPCQDYSRALRHTTSGYPRLLDPIRERFQAPGMPYVIENVHGAPLPHQTTLDGVHGIELCGTMFGLRCQCHGAPVWRHRLFETSFPIGPPRGCLHVGRPINPYRGDNDAYWGHDRSERSFREAMGVPWMNRPEGREAIPPAYTGHIGHVLLTELAVTP